MRFLALTIGAIGLYLCFGKAPVREPERGAGGAGRGRVWLFAPRFAALSTHIDGVGVLWLQKESIYLQIFSDERR